MVFDEPQDALIPHPNRKPVYTKLGSTGAGRELQRIYPTATCPPHLHKQFCKASFVPNNIRVIRASTDRPEIGYHCISLDPPKSGVSVFEATVRLVTALKSTLQPKERIIVFFMNTLQVNAFGREMRCAVYHSQLSPIGNTKSYNLSLWDTGESPVLAASVACAFGINRPYIRHAVIYQGTYGALYFDQQIGRIGRKGEHSNAYLIHNVNISKPLKHLYNSVKDPECHFAMQEYINNFGLCRRWLLRRTMDGKDLAKTCNQIPGCNPCDVCVPDSDAAVFAKNAVANPIARPPRPPMTSVTSHPAIKPGPVYAPHQVASVAQTEDEDIYDAHIEEFTPSMANDMDALTAQCLSSVSSLSYYYLSITF